MVSYHFHFRINITKCWLDNLDHFLIKSRLINYKIGPCLDVSVTHLHVKLKPYLNCVYSIYERNRFFFVCVKDLKFKDSVKSHDVAHKSSQINSIFDYENAKRKYQQINIPKRLSDIFFSLFLSMCLHQ